VRLAWILMVIACHHGDAPPPAPTCTAAADHVRALLTPGAPRSARIRDVVAARCDADAWSLDVRECVVATTSLHHPRHCKAKLTAEQRNAFDRELAALEGAAPRSRACGDYRALIEKLAACQAVPRPVRAAFERGYIAILQALSQEGVTDARALDAQCRSMADNLRQALASTCGL
jgi:hypothetical protein